MATRVSCGFADMTISFDMNTPQRAADEGGDFCAGAHVRARPVRRQDLSSPFLRPSTSHLFWGIAFLTRRALHSRLRYSRPDRCRRLGHSFDLSVDEAPHADVH